MARFHTYLIVGAALVSGCVQTVTRQELDQAIRDHAHETVNWVSYAGSRAGFHYLHHSHALGTSVYRIPEAQLTIEDPFPVTRRKRAWRPLKRHWDAWEVPKTENVEELDTSDVKQ